MPDKPSALAPELVKEFVGVSHGNLNRVSELLAETPTLVNACHDWGGGDFETALGAASHMGRPDIASLLLEHGAHMDIYCAAMMGNLDLVRAIIDGHPEARSAPGAHGISLLSHAEAGGAPAATVVEYLKSIA